MTVGDLRKLLNGADDAMPVYIFDELCAGVMPCTEHSGVIDLPSADLIPEADIPTERLFVRENDTEGKAFCLFTPGTMNPVFVLHNPEVANA